MTTHQHTDLLGDPLPDPLPEGERLTDVDQLVGHTIKAVFERPRCGPHFLSADLVLVTETRCWITFEISSDDDDASLEVSGGYHLGLKPQASLSDYVGADELLRGGCIHAAEHAVLKAEEVKLEEEEKAKKAAFYRRRLEELEGKQPNATQAT